MSCDIFVSLTKIVRSEEKLICADSLSLSPTERKVDELETENKEKIYVEFQNKSCPELTKDLQGNLILEIVSGLQHIVVGSFHSATIFHCRRMQLPLINTSNPC